MFLVILVFFSLLMVFAGVPILYFLYMRRLSKKAWNLTNDSKYLPLVSIIVPMHNEEKIIRFKLQNLAKISYPREKLQIIIVNDNSTDGSLQAVTDFQNSNKQENITLLNNDGRRGKIHGLNLALKNSLGEVVAVSDADCFWRPEALSIAINYLSDPSVGAVTGLELLLNSGETWVTETEVLYNGVAQTIQVGESKYHSTVIFQGGFAAYKKSFLDHFDEKADDSGTALDLINRGVRTLLVPDIIYYTMVPRSLKGKVAIKLRRANSMVGVWIKCLKCALEKNSCLPVRIMLPEVFLYLINPFVFLSLAISYFLLPTENLTLFLILTGLLLFSILIKKTRIALFEIIQDHVFLLAALFMSITPRKVHLWATEADTRQYLTRQMLESKGLT